MGEIRIVLLHQCCQLALGQRNPLVECAAVVGKDRAGDKGVVEERHIRVLPFDQGIVPARIDKGITSQASGDPVIPGAGIKHVIEGGPNELVIARAGFEPDSDEVWKHRCGRRIVISHAGEIKDIVTFKALHHDRVPFGPDTAADHDHTHTLPHDPDILHALGPLRRIDGACHKPVGAGRTFNDQDIRIPVVGNDQHRHFHHGRRVGICRIVVVILFRRTGITIIIHVLRPPFCHTRIDHLLAQLDSDHLDA